MKIVLTFLLLFIYCISFSQIKMPKDFKELTESPANGKKLERVEMDFDGDLINDVALLVVNEKEFSNYRFLIYISSLKKQYEVVLNKTDFSIYPVQLKVLKNTIQFGYFQDGTSTFGRFIKIRYNLNKKKIQIIGYDTGYKSLPTEHIDKSYNLITGKYIVRRTKLNDDEEPIIEEFEGQNNFFKNKVYIDNLSIEMLRNLDDVGSKYE